MSFSRAVYVESRKERRSLATALVLGGLSSLLLLTSIQSSLRSLSNREASGLLAFALFGCVYAISIRYTNQRIVAIIEALLHRMRVRAGSRLATAELNVLERKRAAEICDRLTENITLISERAGVLASFLQSLFTMAFALVYIPALSWTAFTLIVICGGLGLLVFVQVRKEFVVHSQRSDATRVRFIEALTDLLSGFKEVKLSQRRSQQVCEEIDAAAGVLRDSAVQANNLVSDGALIAEGTLFVLLSAMICLPAALQSSGSHDRAQLVATVLLLWSPFRGIAAGIVPYIRSSLALAELEKIEGQLSQAAGPPATNPQPAVPTDPWQGRVTQIEARALEYAYTEEEGGETFRIGPIDLQIRTGEVVFVVGGNGSGKSTLSKVLAGLYLPQTGQLVVDGHAVDAANAAAYRECVCSVFSDFHLFDKLYGIQNVNAAAALALLSRMQLEKKTAIVDRTFSTTRLSTGQRKRLALVVALLEDRPICVFDEWAADQDPEFRKTFYKELLPLLRQQGRAVLVISHDDRYFDCADRVVTMEYGKVRAIVEQEPGRPHAPRGDGRTTA